MADGLRAGQTSARIQGMETSTAVPLSGPDILAALQEARQRTLALVADLDDDQLMGTQLKIVNPLLWEIGHVAGPLPEAPVGEPLDGDVEIRRWCGHGQEHLPVGRRADRRRPGQPRR